MIWHLTSNCVCSMHSLWSCIYNYSSIQGLLDLRGDKCIEDGGIHYLKLREVAAETNYLLVRKFGEKKVLSFLCLHLLSMDSTMPGMRRCSE